MNDFSSLETSLARLCVLPSEHRTNLEDHTAFNEATNLGTTLQRAMQRCILTFSRERADRGG